MTGGQTIGELFAEEEARRIAEASTPERIAADAALFERNRIKTERELASLRAQGMIDDEFCELCQRTNELDECECEDEE